MVQTTQITTPLTDSVEIVGLKMDAYFIGGMVCVAFGLFLIIIAVAYLLTWCCRLRNTKRQEKLRRRHLEHMRHLEEYSIKAGDSPNGVIKHNNNTPSRTEDDVFMWETSDLVNMGYVSDDTLEKLSQKGPKLEAHINGSSSSFALQAPRSRTGSSSSRPGSVASRTESTGGAKGRHSRSNSDSKQPKSSSYSNVTTTPDRLADVPV